MGVETAAYISDLSASLPAGGDPKSQGDDHIRLIKAVLQASLPNISGAVSATHIELNYVNGVTSPIQPQIDAKAPSASPAFTGTVSMTSAASVLVPTASLGDSSNKAASTAFAATLAFNAALPGQTGNAGKFVTTDGTSASWTSLAPITPRTFSLAALSFTATSGGLYLTDTSATALSMAAITAPSTGACFEVRDHKRTWHLNPLTICRNGSTVAGIASDFTCDVQGGSVEMVYDGTTWRPT